MNLKQLINNSVYGTIGYISSQDDIDLLESYILYNLLVLKEFKHIVVATNYKELDLQLINRNIDMWEKHFPNCYLIDSEVNRGHNFGTADLDNLIFDWCKENNEEWLCKVSNDVILQESILNKNVDEADFYYLIGISYEDLYLNNFNYKKILDKFFPQTNFYLINVSKCDYLNNKDYLDITYKQMKTISNYNGKIWEYIEGWSCELFLKQCVERNNLTKHYLLDINKHNKLCDAVRIYGVGDPSHKNIMIEGICHFHSPNQDVIEI